MSSTVEPILFYNPVWTINDLIGQPNVNGFIYFYDSLNPTDLKTIYKDSLLTDPWPNPIEFNVNGAQDDNYPIYGTNDGPYRVEITEDDGTPIYVFDPFPYADTGSPIVPDQEITNQVPNGQFNYAGQLSYSPVPTTITNVVPGHDFIKTNTSATDTLTVQQLNIGQTTVPAFPRYQINYVCTGPGSGETQKDYIIYISDAFAYSATELTMSINASSSTANTLEFLFVQNFGTGGSPSTQVSTTIASQVLTAQPTDYTFTFTVPSANGKSLGTTTQGYTALVFRLPLNAACNITFDNAGLYIGDSAPDYQYQPLTKTKAQVVGLEYPTISTVNPADGVYYPVLAQGATELGFKSLAGTIVDKGFAYRAGWDGLQCNGALIHSASYYNLVNSISTNYGIGTGGFYSDSPNGVTLNTTATGVAAAAAQDVSTHMYIYTSVTGAVGVNQKVQIICIPSEYIPNSSYFFASNTTTDFYFWFNLSGTGVDPAIGGRTGIEVAYTGTETAAQIAALIAVKTMAGTTFNVPTNTITAINIAVGSVTAISVGTSALTVAQTVAGSGSVQAQSTIDLVAGSSIINGSYLTINTPTIDYYLWFSKNNKGQDPSLLSILSGKVGIKVVYSGTETAVQMAALCSQQLINAQVKIPGGDGLFRRQVANGSSNDPNRNSRIALTTGGTTGDNVGSYQADEIVSHSHIYVAGSPGAGPCALVGTDPNANFETEVTGGSETRPKNYYTDSVILI